jgi:hypothetical protein
VKPQTGREELAADRGKPLIQEIFSWLQWTSVKKSAAPSRKFQIAIPDSRTHRA